MVKRTNRQSNKPTNKPTKVTRRQMVDALNHFTSYDACELSVNDLRQTMIELSAEIFDRMTDIEVTEQYNAIMQQVKDDFTQWTGGDLPSDAEEVEEYVASSLPGNIDEDSARTFLLSLID